MNIKKVKLIDEIISGLNNDSTANTMLDDLFCICHAPHLGYRNWIFKYKSIYVLFFDEGNGHYQYLAPLTWIDVIKAKLVGGRLR